MNLRRPLLHPADYFADTTPSWGHALGIVAASATVMALSAFLSGVIIGAEFANAGASVPAGRRNGIALTAAFLVFAGTLVLWAVTGALLHTVVLLANQGEADSLEATFGVAAWGFPLSAISGVIAFVVVAGSVLAAPTASAPEQVLEQLRNPLLGGGIVSLGLNSAVACWQTYVWGYGLHERHEPGLKPLVAGSFVVAFTFVAASAV